MAGKIRIILAGFLLVNIALKTNGQTQIPPNVAQLNAWFQTAVKPLAQAKTLDPNVAEAEAGTPEMILVRQDGSGKFKTITDALKHVKIGNKKRVIISVGPGEYREKVTVERFKAYITMMASDPAKMPTLVYAGTAAQYGTVNSATIIVEADNFVAYNMIFANSAPRPTGATKGGQALAIRISGDRAAFYNCRFTGFQDTICDDKGNHIIKDCYIEGTVDFIFGGGRSLYLNTEIHIIPGDLEAYIVASARKNENEKGLLSFVHCRITGGGKKGYAFLARAWYQSGRVVFSFCELSDIVSPEGWSDGKYPQMVKTVYFGEFENKGPGAALDKRVPFTKKLTPKDATEFISLESFDAPKWLLPPPKI